MAFVLELAFGIDINDETISGAFSVKDIIVGITDALKTAKKISIEDQGISLGPKYWKELLQVDAEKRNFGDDRTGHWLLCLVISIYINSHRLFNF